MNKHSQLNWLWLLMLCLVGCETGQETTGGFDLFTDSNDLPAVKEPPITDLPVPEGFRLDLSRSRSYESHRARYVDHTYVGRAETEAVQGFYVPKMRAAGWRLTEARVTGRETLQKYRRRKPNETCEVRIIEVERFAVFNDPLINVVIQVRNEQPGHSYLPYRQTTK